MVDVSDAPESQGVMLAFLPTNSDWCNIDLPHMTLVYAGTIDRLKPSDFNALAKDAAALAMFVTPFTLRVLGVEIFGPETDRVRVLKFQPTVDLLAMRRAVEGWNASEYPFNPHATIGPAPDPVEFVPRSVGFNRLLVAWGDEHITFWLKGARQIDY